MTRLTLLRLEARVGLVDDIDDTLAAHDLTVAVTTFERLKRAADFHGFHLIFDKGLNIGFWVQPYRLRANNKRV